MMQVTGEDVLMFRSRPTPKVTVCSPGVTVLLLLKYLTPASAQVTITLYEQFDMGPPRDGTHRVVADTYARDGRRGWLRCKP